jgi:hypothetical protein
MDELILEDTKNQTWKNDKSGFGFKMLQKMVELVCPKLVIIAIKFLF